MSGLAIGNFRFWFRPKFRFDMSFGLAQDFGFGQNFGSKCNQKPKYEDNICKQYIFIKKKNFQEHFKKILTK
jgi:hypothetical protein